MNKPTSHMLSITEPGGLPVENGCTTDLYDCSVWSSTGNPHNSLHYKNIYVFFVIITHTEKSGAESLTIINNWNIVWIKKASLVFLSKEHLFILYYNSAWKASPLLCSPVILHHGVLKLISGSQSRRTED